MNGYPKEEKPLGDEGLLLIYINRDIVSGGQQSWDGAASAKPLFTTDEYVLGTAQTFRPPLSKSGIRRPAIRSAIARCALLGV